MRSVARGLFGSPFLLKRRLVSRLGSSAVEARCWKCGASITGCCVLFCKSDQGDGCGAIQQLDMSVGACNFYDLFSLPDKKSITVDLTTLEARFKTLQRALHPDKFATSSTQEKVISASNSSIVNQGYQTLKSRISRTNYVLKTFFGINILDAEGKSYADDAGLMVEIFELRERVEEIPAGDKKEMLKITEEVDSALEAVVSRLEAVLQQSDPGNDIVKLAVRFQYLSKVKQELVEREG